MDISGVQCQANVGPERDHIHQEHCTSTPLQQQPSLGLGLTVNV
ncbi:hypothetical protein HaLaN_00376, partial [Haematococcus lacustris]